MTYSYGEFRAMVIAIQRVRVPARCTGWSDFCASRGDMAGLLAVADKHGIGPHGFSDRRDLVAVDLNAPRHAAAIWG